MAGGVHGDRADLACPVDGQHRGRCPAVRRDQQAVPEMPNRPNARPRCNSLSGMTERREPRRSYAYAWVGTPLSPTHIESFVGIRAHLVAGAQVEMSAHQLHVLVAKLRPDV
jgi:hypothetical protein